MGGLLVRLATAGGLIGTGYVHADLYANGYRVIPWVGPGFLVLAAGCFAVGALLLVGRAGVLWLCAAGLAAGALVGFLASRTVGVFGFVEHGLQPAPQALLSLVFEAVVLVLCAGWAAALVRARRTRAAAAAQPSVAGHYFPA